MTQVSHHQSLLSLPKPLSLLHQRTDKRHKKNHSPTATKTKPHHRKLISMIKQKVTSQLKGQDKTPEKQLNDVDVGNSPQKVFRIMIMNMIQDLGKIMEGKIEKIQEMLPKTYKN